MEVKISLFSVLSASKNSERQLMGGTSFDELLLEAADRLRKAKRIVAFTGAGVSAESGIPTFRDAMSGLWSNFRPEDLASREGFMADPKNVWEWYESRRAMILQYKPNPGHYALAAMEKRFQQFVLVTQNVDELHARAGSKRVIELHGRIMENRCFEEDRMLSDIELDRSSVPPRCPCGSFARPGVVWFGESLPSDALAEAFAAADRCDVCLIAGTSGVVYPAASIPLTAFRSGAFVIEVNPEESALTEISHVFLQGKAGEILPVLESKL